MATPSAGVSYLKVEPRWNRPPKQKHYFLLPEESIASVNFSPVHLLQVPVDIPQYIHPAAFRPVDDAYFLFDVWESSGWVILQFPDVPHDIGATVVGVFVKQDDHPVKSDKGSQVIYGLLVLDFPLGIEGEMLTFLIPLTG
jgi:hypothetical protein